MSHTTKRSKPYPSDNERRADAGMKAIEASTDCEFRADGLAGCALTSKTSSPICATSATATSSTTGLLTAPPVTSITGISGCASGGRRGLPPNDGSVANRMGERVAGDE